MKTYNCGYCLFHLSEEEFKELQYGDDLLLCCPVCAEYSKWYENENGLSANTENMIVLFKKIIKKEKVND